MDDKIKSPITNSYDVSCLKKIPKNEIVSRYKKRYNICVKRLFQNIENISLYQCNKTNFSFFYPFDIAGDSDFYEDLYNNKPYYFNKWEYTPILNMIEDQASVFEFGCGNGNFLKLCKDNKIECTGIDLNKSAIDSIDDTLFAYNTDLKEFAQNHQNEFDYVVSFQVLEHVTDVKDTLDNLLFILKSNGKLIISVPNNASFIQFANYNLLNMPPHHMGLWYPETLRQLPLFYPIKLDNIIFEELQPIHYKWYANINLQYLTDQYGYLGKIAKRALRPFLMPGIRNISSTITGHTMIGIFSNNRS